MLMPGARYVPQSAPGGDPGSHPTRPARSLRVPGAAETEDRQGPRIDDHLAAPETREEYLAGVKVHTLPAQPPHATRHFNLSYVLGAHVARGYQGAVDMLTRASEANDFAPDASIFATGLDPATNQRYLEELAFEVADRQSMTVPTDKARSLSARGVRRIFCIWVKQGAVLEWSPGRDDWDRLPLDACIEDPCLVRPLPIAALVDSAAADAAAVRALVDKHVPALDAVLDEREARGLEQGRNEGLMQGRNEGLEQGYLEGALGGLRKAVQAILMARGVPIPPAVTDRLTTCRDPALLERWLTHLARGQSVELLLAEPCNGSHES